MEVKLVNRGDTGELLLIGRLDGVSTPEVQKIFALMPERFHSVVLNLSQMEYTSSAGLRAILTLQKSMMKIGGDLKISGAGPMVMDVFEMTGFASFLTFIK